MIDLVELVQIISNSKTRPVALKQINRTPGKERWRGLCPFHNEKTGSFDVFVGSDGKARFYCHGCQEKGDGIDWLRKVERRSYREAGGAAPDPEVARLRVERQVRDAAIRVWRDCNPDCPIPDFLLDVGNGSVPSEQSRLEKYDSRDIILLYCPDGNAVKSAVHQAPSVCVPTDLRKRG